MTAGTPKLTWRGRIIALGLGVLLLLVIAEGTLRLAMPHWQEFHSGWFITRTAVPGHGVVYTGRPGFDGYFSQNDGDFRIRLALNSFGLRNPEEIAAAHDRAWIVGDSMTFGWGVEREDIYSTVAARLSGLATYNIASPGTDVCGYQALLARMPRNLYPRAVVIGLVLENDVAAYDCSATFRDQAQAGEATDRRSIRNLTELKVLLTRMSSLYNFVAINLKRVDFFNRVFMKVGLVSQPHLLTHNVGAGSIREETEKTAHEIRKLKDALPPKTPFAVLVMPTRFEIRDNYALQRELRLAMLAALDKSGIAAIDPAPAFISAGFAQTHFRHDGHWNAHGHFIAGEAIARWLSAVLTKSSNP